MKGVRVGLLDSGLGGDMAGRAVAAAAFAVMDDFSVAEVPCRPDPIGHGTAIARLMTEAVPAAELLSAQVFTKGGVTSAAAVAAGLDWLRAQRAQVVSMSFGLRDDREVLRRACAAAIEADMILVAAMPARGAPVYPAAYSGVIAATGDARCAPGEISVLEAGLFGACPRPPAAQAGSSRIGGASFAVGHLCGVVAAALCRHMLSVGEVAIFLDGQARYRGRERKSAAHA